MSFNQYRTNPSQAVSNFKGRTDTPKAWPGTRVATWTNGGLFGGASLKSFFAEIGAAVNGGSHAGFTMKAVRTNVFDGKTYVAGVWDQYAGAGFNFDYGPCIGQLKKDGSPEFEWFTMCWYNDSNYYPNGDEGQISFQAGSSDVFYATPGSLAGISSTTWCRFSDAGALLNANNDGYTSNNGRNLVGIVPATQTISPNAVYGAAAGNFGGFQVLAYTNWANKTDNLPTTTAVGNVNSYVNYGSSMEGPLDGATYYEGNVSNPRVGHLYCVGNGYYNNKAHLFRRDQGNNNNVSMKLINGWGTRGTCSAYGSGDNILGLVMGNYPNKVALTLPYAGDFAWSRLINTVGAGSNLQITNSFAPHMDIDENIYITGECRFDGSNQKTFVLKLDSSGAVVWTREIGLSVGGSNTSSAGKQVTTSADGTKVYITHYIGYLQYSGSGTTIFPRTVLTCMNADGSDTGSFLIDNSSGFGGGTANTYTIAAAALTVSADTLTFTPSALNWAAPNNGNQGVGQVSGKYLQTATPFSANGNKPIMPSVII